MAEVMARQGVVLGKAYGRTLRYDGEAHTLVVAPSGSGKTVNVVKPTALSCQDRSFFVHDPKNEIHPESAAWRATFSKVIHLDPTSPTSDCYDPCQGIRLGTSEEIRDALLLTDMLIDPNGEPATSDAGRHFRELTNGFLLGVVLHGLYTNQATTLVQLDDFFMSEASLDAVVADMRTTHHTKAGMHRAVRRGLAMFARLADRELSGVCTTVSRSLQLTLDPLVAQMTSRSDFTLRDLRERTRPLSLYLTVPYSDMERLRPLSRLIVRQVLDYCTSRLTGWRWRLTMLIDEVQALNRIPQIPSALNYVRGFGCNLCLVTPSLNELDRVYGIHNTFLESSHVRLIFAPNDPKVAETFSAMTGTVETTKVRETTGRGRTTSTSVESERLLSWTGVTFLPKNRGLLFVGNGAYPALITKAPYYRNWRLTRRSTWKGGPCFRTRLHSWRTRLAAYCHI
jgi:type IV secretion system protein VirD4